mmetsp:Transcript_62593/g.147200  ORF Transcript_62593/g.147200 Transcript_62593/m.147200 type:complete len:222 (+) Transcript_62593:1211-1876(+)
MQGTSGPASGVPAAGQASRPRRSGQASCQTPLRTAWHLRDSQRRRQHRQPRSRREQPHPARLQGHDLHERRRSNAAHQHARVSAGPDSAGLDDAGDERGRDVSEVARRVPEQQSAGHHVERERVRGRHRAGPRRRLQRLPAEAVRRAGAERAHRRPAARATALESRNAPNPVPPRGNRADASVGPVGGVELGQGVREVAHGRHGLDLRHRQPAPPRPPAAG